MWLVVVMVMWLVMIVVGCGW